MHLFQILNSNSAMEMSPFYHSQNLIFSIYTLCETNAEDGAAGCVIQFDSNSGINWVDLDLLTLASNTHLPSTSLDFQFCLSPNSIVFFSFSTLIFSQLISDSSFLLLFICPPLPRYSSWAGPSENITLSLLCTNYLCSLPPSVDKCWCQDQCNTGKPQTSMWHWNIERVHKTTQVSANAWPPTHSHTVTESFEERHKT